MASYKKREKKRQPIVEAKGVHTPLNEASVMHMVKHEYLLNQPKPTGVEPAAKRRKEEEEDKTILITLTMMSNPPTPEEFVAFTDKTLAFLERQHASDKRNEALTRRDGRTGVKIEPCIKPTEAFALEQIRTTLRNIVHTNSKTTAHGREFTIWMDLMHILSTMEHHAPNLSLVLLAPTEHAQDVPVPIMQRVKLMEVLQYVKQRLSDEAHARYKIDITRGLWDKEKKLSVGYK